MSEESPRATSNPALPHPDLIPHIQFYSMELSHLADGGVFVSIGATLSEGDGDLSNMDIISQRVATFDEAIRLIAQSVRLAPQLKQ